MKKKTLIIWISILIGFMLVVFANPGQIFTKAILRLTGNYITPKDETSASILSKIQMNNIYYDRLFRLSELKSLKDFQAKKISSVPFVQIYNEDKKIITMASGSNCAWALLNYFNKNDTSKLVEGDSMMYQFIMDRLEPIDLKTNQDTFEAYIFAGWANYIPKLSKGLFNQTNEIMESNKGKVCLSYINLDFQEGWEAEMESDKKK